MDRLKYITHLVYWYGNSHEMNMAYSLAKSVELNDYKNGLKQVETKLISLKKKEDSGKSLTKKDAALLRGVEEMHKDLEKDPSNRHGYVPDEFLEDYEYPSEEEISDEEAVPEEQPQAGRPKDRKKKAAKNKKKKKEADEPQVGNSTGSAKGKPTVSKKVMKKTPKKATKRETTAESLKEPRPKKKARALDEGDDNETKPTEDREADATELNDQSIETKAATLETNTEEFEEVRLSAYDEALAAIGDVSSHDEADDDFDGSTESGDDEAYGGIERGNKRSAKTLKSKKAQNPPKERAKKKVTKAKTKIEKRPKGEKRTASNEALKKAEQRSFELCEMKYLKLIRQWRKAISNKDGDQITRIYVQLLENMDNFTAPFMEEYDMSLLMKQSKAIVNDDKRREVMAAFKEAYPRKLAKVPEGFKPCKESEKVDLERANQPNEETVVDNSKSTKQVPVKESTAPSDDPKPSMALDEAISDEKTESQDYASVKHSKATLIDQSELRSMTQSSKAKPENTSRSDVAPQEEKEQRETQQQRSNPVKLDRRKKFSLETLMRPSASVQSTAKPAVNSSSPFRRNTSSASLSKSNKDDQGPTWTEVLVNRDCPTDRNRVLALEFLEQAAAFIPEGKNINHDTIVRNLEGAIYEWATTTGLQMRTNGVLVKRQQNGRGTISIKEEGSFPSRMDEKGSKRPNGEKECFDEDARESHSVDYDEPWVDSYWEKIHNLTACLSGNEKKDGTIATLISEGKFKTAHELVGLSDEDLWKSFQSEPLPRFSVLGRL